MKHNDDCIKNRRTDKDTRGLIKHLKEGGLLLYEEENVTELIDKDLILLRHGCLCGLAKYPSIHLSNYKHPKFKEGMKVYMVSDDVRHQGEQYKDIYTQVELTKVEITVVYDGAYAVEWGSNYDHVDALQIGKDPRDAVLRSRLCIQKELLEAKMEVYRLNKVYKLTFVLEKELKVNRKCKGVRDARPAGKGSSAGNAEIS